MIPEGRKFDFSVLMSVYYKANPAHLYLALSSIIEQTVGPSQVVIVKDGRLTPELDVIINEWKKKMYDLFCIVELPVNGGLGMALKVGLEKCRYEFVARMDADDICDKQRFEKQIVHLQRNPDVDIVGGWIAEFSSSLDEDCLLRKVPEHMSEIYRLGLFRSPVNHVTVMFRRSSVMMAGGYQDCSGAEDYHLWARMLKCGCKFYNIQENLVYVRTGSDMYARRGGIQYIKNTYVLQKYFYDIGFTNLWLFVFSTIVRSLVFMFPVSIKRVFYRFALRNS